MSPNREEALFALAVEKPASERAAFLDRECGADKVLRARLEALLAAHERTEPIMDAPAAGLRAEASARHGQVKATMKLEFSENGNGVKKTETVSVNDNVILSNTPYIQDATSVSAMGRRVRVRDPRANYHVMNRGDHQERIFRDDEDRQQFVSTLTECCEKTSWQIRVFCLMSNHFQFPI